MDDHVETAWQLGVLVHSVKIALQAMGQAGENEIAKGIADEFMKRNQKLQMQPRHFVIATRLSYCIITPEGGVTLCVEHDEAGSA